MIDKRSERTPLREVDTALLIASDLLSSPRGTRMFAHQLAYLEKKHPGKLELYKEMLSCKEAWGQLSRKVRFEKMMQSVPSDDLASSTMETIAECIDRVVCTQEILLLSSIRLDFFESMLSAPISEDTRG